MSQILLVKYEPPIHYLRLASEGTLLHFFSVLILFYNSYFRRPILDGHNC